MTQANFQDMRRMAASLRRYADKAEPLSEKELNSMRLMAAYMEHLAGTLGGIATAYAEVDPDATPPVPKPPAPFVPAPGWQPWWIQASQWIARTALAYMIPSRSTRRDA